MQAASNGLPTSAASIRRALADPGNPSADSGGEPLGSCDIFKHPEPRRRGPGLIQGGERASLLCVGLVGAGMVSWHHLTVCAHILDRLGDGAAFETSPADNLQTPRLVEGVYAKAAAP